MFETRVLRAADYVVMPWKNGGGSTVEIWRASLEPGDSASYDMRVSRAEVPGPGPFSRFQGYDRILIQLAGPSMTLTHEGRTGATLEPLVPYCFSSDWDTDCQCTGATTDLNIFARREVVSAAAACFTLGPGENREFDLSGRVSVVYLVTGSITINSGETHGVNQGETWVSGSRRASVSAAGTSATGVVVRFFY